MRVPADHTSDASFTEVRNFAADRPEIQAAFVFGSVAAGTAHEGSDLDVAVLLEQDPDADRSIRLGLSYSVELEDRLNRVVDLVILNTACPMLRFQVFRKGKMVHSKNLQRSRRFIAHALVEFYDEIVLLERIQKRAIRRLIGR